MLRLFQCDWEIAVAPQICAAHKARLTDDGCGGVSAVPLVFVRGADRLHHGALAR